MYKTEMHLHTVGNSYCGEENAARIIEIYKAAGYNAITVTNHFSKHIFYEYFCDKGDSLEKIDFYLKQYRELKTIGAQQGIDVFFGMELALGEDNYDNPKKNNCAELLIYGITSEEFIDYNVTICEMNYEQFFEFCQKHGWLVIQAHPYRARTQRIKIQYLNGIEVYNGHPGHNDRNHFAQARAKAHNLLKTAGSDFHYLGGESTAMDFPRKINNEKDLALAIKEGEAKIIKRHGKK